MQIVFFSCFHCFTECSWALVSEIRNGYKNPSEFDDLWVQLYCFIIPLPYTKLEISFKYKYWYTIYVSFLFSLYKNLSLVVDNPETAYPNVKTVWSRFQSLFGVSGGLLFYSHAFERYYTQALQTFYDDNVQYIEFRAMLPPVSILH